MNRRSGAKRRLGIAGAHLFLGGHAPDELPERRRPPGGAVERRRRRGRRPVTATAAVGRHHLVRVRRRGRRRRDPRVGRELPAAGAAAGALGRSAAAHVFVFAGRRERVVDVRHEPGQRAAGHGPFGRRRRRVRERARRQAFREFSALQLDVRRGHPVCRAAQVVERETTSDKPRSLFPEQCMKSN